MPTFKTITLGCKVNQYETQYLREGLLRAGFRETPTEPADLCIVNTCTVTAQADAKSRKALRQLARENPGSRIIVIGCYAARAAEQLARFPNVVQVVTDKAKLPDLLEQLGANDLPEGISRFGNRHRAYVKVQDGCRMQCSYCIVPRVRPVLRSRPPDQVCAEVSQLVDNGYREIVLTGIHLGHYGIDLAEHQGDPPNLAMLVQRLLQLDGSFRIRLSSLEAVELSEPLLELMADNPSRVCPHLHLPLQSGSYAVLSRMRRRWAAHRFEQRCDQVRRYLDQPALTTDVIVGFPGETDADFEQTCRLVQRLEFSKLHVFRFSPREGTAAANMPDQVPSHVKNQRAEHLGRLGMQLRRRFIEKLCGRTLQVLVESVDERWIEGTADRYVRVRAENTGNVARMGQLVIVGNCRPSGCSLVGTLDPFEETPVTLDGPGGDHHTRGVSDSL